MKEIIDFLIHYIHPVPVNELSAESPLFGTGETARPTDFLKPESPRHEEIAGAFSPAKWVEKNQVGGFATYPKRDQKSKSDCTCYTAAKLLSIDELSEGGIWREFSPDSVYPYLVVPTGGANSVQVLNFVKERGMTLEHLYASDSLTEDEARKSDKIPVDAKQVGLIYKPSAVVECAADFETIASIIENYRLSGKKKGVGITIIGSQNGTWLNPFPMPPSQPNNVWFHKVTVTDFGLIDGKKYLSIDNSWGERAGLRGQQFIGEDYQKYIYGGVYTVNMPDDWLSSGSTSAVPPKHQWASDLLVGSSGPDVLALQQALQSMGMFPVSKIIQPTGAYYGVTKKGVELFQAAFGLPVTGVVDAVTRAKLNSIF